MVENAGFNNPGIINIHRARPGLINNGALFFGGTGMREYGGTYNRQGVKLLVRRCPKSRAYENIC
jgi:hypothetical protein